MAEGPEDHFLLSCIYYMAGDVHFFNNAPAAAIRAFKKSARHDPAHAEAYRELGERYAEIGCLGIAEKYLKKAVALGPDDTWARADLDDLPGQAGTSRQRPKGEERDTWIFCELCARNEFGRALSRWEEPRSSQARLYRAAAWGALGRADEFFREWEGILEADDPISIQSFHWFFIPPPILGSERFWESLLKCSHRFLHGNYLYHRSLWEAVHEKHRRADDIHNLQTVIRLYAWFELARIRKDPKLLKLWVEKYPGWKEAAALKDRLHKASGRRARSLPKI
ncbi:MAG: hypothetical protein AB1921_05890 [Thermodesulfobacteriota bacterium]